jgi:hypothetical protein
VEAYLPVGSVHVGTGNTRVTVTAKRSTSADITLIVDNTALERVTVRYNGTDYTAVLSGTTYTASVPYAAVSSFAVTAVPAVADAAVGIDGATPVNGTATGTGIGPLAVGANTFPIRVEAGTGHYTEYTLELIIEPNTNADLTGLAVNPGTLTPIFSASTAAYTVTVASTVTSIYVTATKTDAHTLIIIDSTAAISGTANTVSLSPLGYTAIPIVVTAQDGTTTKTYTINIVTIDAEDFGSGSTIANTFAVTDASSWASAVSSINTGGNDKNYIINVTGAITIPGVQAETFTTPTGITVSLRGGGSIAITISGWGEAVWIKTGQTLILRDITLTGGASNAAPVVEVNSAGTLKMYDGAKISGNTNGGNAGGVVSQGSFTMYGGIISGNTGLIGGVMVLSGPFIKTGGIIYGNTGDSNANVSTNGNTYGHAVLYADYYRDTTLDTGDNISTSALPASGTEFNWTKQ